MSLRFLATATALVLGLIACSKQAGDREPGAGGAKTVCGLDEASIGRFALIDGGSFIMGASPVYPEEGPSVRVHVDSFYMLVHEVTVGEFRTFIESTGYGTDAERVGDKGGSATFSAGARGGWRLDPAVNWRAGSQAGDRAPVVHVSRNDAAAYAAWAGGRLPSEIEWEYAAATGMESGASGGVFANVWQGVFPFRDEGTDGFRGVAPVGCFGANDNGLYDMIGNVWEWTDTDSPAYGESVGAGVIKGGSYLCSDNYCRRYRPEARQAQDVDFSASHIGFRIVKNAGEAP